MNRAARTAMPGNAAPHRYCFVAGLHRTGTSLVARTIGSHPAIATITDAGVPENEGCYLQGGIAHTARHGVPGEYATDPDQHFTEDSPLNTLDTVRRLEHDWGKWFDPAKPWRLEKSPVNLTRMRLLQALFPMAHFIVVTRHPAVMAQALRKWSDRPAAELARYGAQAYARMLDDLEWLHAAMVLRYEDFVAHPDRVSRSVELFLGLDTGIAVPQVRDGNRDYDVGRDPFGPDISLDEERAMATLGYDLDGSVCQNSPIVRHPLHARRDTVKAGFANT